MRLRTQAAKLVFDHPEDAAAWLRERRDLQERHETGRSIARRCGMLFSVSQAPAPRLEYKKTTGRARMLAMARLGLKSLPLQPGNVPI
jgi:hypothetical protein